MRGLELPSVRGGRDRIASPEEAARLIAALPESDRALWATALYAGLRRGELMALRWEDIDLAAGVIRVERSYDPTSGRGRDRRRGRHRTVPIASVLRGDLLAHKLRSGRSNGLVVRPHDGTPDRRVDPEAGSEGAGRRAADIAGGRRKAASQAAVPIGLHEARHTFASPMIAAGVNAKALSTYMGHSSVTITLDRYGHLMPGNEAEAAELLDSYLGAATSRS